MQNLDMRGKMLASDSALFVFLDTSYTHSNDLDTSGKAAGNVVNEATDHAKNPGVKSDSLSGTVKHRLRRIDILMSNPEIGAIGALTNRIQLVASKALRHTITPRGTHISRFLTSVLGKASVREGIINRVSFSGDSREGKTACKLSQDS